MKMDIDAVASDFEELDSDEPPPKKAAAKKKAAAPAKKAPAKGRGKKAAVLVNIYAVLIILSMLIISKSESDSDIIEIDEDDEPPITKRTNRAAVLRCVMIFSTNFFSSFLAVRPQRRRLPKRSQQHLAQSRLHSVLLRQVAPQRELRHRKPRAKSLTL